MPLRFEYRAATTIPVEVDGVVEGALKAGSVGEVQRLPVQCGNRREAVGEFFHVSGAMGDGQLQFVGEMSGVHRLAEGMTAGVVRVEGSVGRHLGATMRGGEIHVTGDASDWVGAEMRGGLIHVRGNAGEAVGAAYVGSPQGMGGGVILIDGSVGEKLGHSLRRGLIVIGGDCGEFAALNMFAGTVFVLGRCGARPAAAMRRGTLVLLGNAPPLLPSFRPAGPCCPGFLSVYLRRISQLGLAIDSRKLDADFALWSGDHLNGGRGEILIRQHMASDVC